MEQPIGEDEVSAYVGRIRAQAHAQAAEIVAAASLRAAQTVEDAQRAAPAAQARRNAAEIGAMRRAVPVAERALAQGRARISGVLEEIERCGREQLDSVQARVDGLLAHPARPLPPPSPAPAPARPEPPAFAQLRRLLSGPERY